MIPSYRKPLIPASVMLGDRDLTAGSPAEWMEDPSAAHALAPDQPQMRCQLYSRRCLKRARAKQERRRLVTA